MAEPEASAAIVDSQPSFEAEGEAKADRPSVESAIRNRRTHKVFASEPLRRATIVEVLELARWAPNHKLTNPWRFRVLGRAARTALRHACDALEPGSGGKLDRAPTLVCATAVMTGSQAQQREDLLAAAAACYIVLLAAESRGLASYWRTVPAMETEAGRAALSIPEQESVLGLLHLGRRRQPQRAPERETPERYVSFLP